MYCARGLLTPGRPGHAHSVNSAATMGLNNVLSLEIGGGVGVSLGEYAGHDGDPTGDNGVGRVGLGQIGDKHVYAGDVGWYGGYEYAGDMGVPGDGDPIGDVGV